VLRGKGLKVEESLLGTTESTRKTTGALGNILKYLGDPGNAKLLSRIYRVWRRNESDNPESLEEIDAVAKLIQDCPRVEEYIWPRPGCDWLGQPAVKGCTPEIIHSLTAFKETIQRWQGSVLLPINQIVLMIAGDIFTDPSELALAHKLAQLLRQARNMNSRWGFPELADELGTIAKNERRFLGFSEGDTGFNTEKYKGRVVISTMHKAKGLEWDRVHLMSINEYDFPSGKITDRYFPEKRYIRQTEVHSDDTTSPVILNLVAETLSQLDSLVKPEVHDFYEEGAATRDARLDFIRERLRLFYVGITRAKEELIITSNSGRFGDTTVSVPMEALSEYWENKNFEWD
jgi:DNA helicase-2/ATP-dependent DNA helicase PcrA